ncbi:MAG: hypothetical protein JW760_00070 [Spirochaetales bacterium]|nr:hypothetical protein [Spirochaetales bacterium]
MKRTGGFRTRLGEVLLSDRALRDSLMLLIFSMVVFLLTLPGKSYYFSLAQDLQPATFRICFSAIFPGILFLSLRSCSPDEEISPSGSWAGYLVPRVLRIVFHVFLVTPFLIMAGRLSGVSLVRLLSALLFLSGASVGVKLLSLSLELLSVNRWFLRNSLTLGIFFLTFIGLGALPGFPWFVDILLSPETGRLKDILFCAAGFWLFASVVFLLAVGAWKRRKAL